MLDIDTELFGILEDETTTASDAKEFKEIEKEVMPEDNGDIEGVDKKDLEIGPDADKNNDVGEEPEEELPKEVEADVKAEMENFEYLSNL